jgi:MIP family channel proteins
LNKLARGCVAEFLGTFALTFFGAASIVLTDDRIKAGSLPTIALAHGLVLSVFVPACMYISGAQFNPAVSLGLVVAKVQSLQRAVVFIVVQCVASIAAAGALLGMVREYATGPARLGATLGMLSDQGNVAAVMCIEAILTFVLMFVILAAVVDARAHKMGGFVVGMAVAAGICAAGPLTGASMNPARSLGPALVGGYWEMHYAYWIAPIAGAALAGLVYRFVWLERGVSAS